ncbi:MAG: type II secretion system protein GspG [Acidobacteria bacterium]|nr:type II secretion system protein GspG [Acidobacteriota bacterium]
MTIRFPRALLALAALAVTASCSSTSPVKDAQDATAEAADAYAKGLVRGIDRGKSDRAESDLGNARRALEQYAADESGYPDAGSCAELISKLPSRGPSLPEKDPWGNPYDCRTSRTSYSIRSAGQDGALNTGDDVVAEGGAPPAP